MYDAKIAMIHRINYFETWTDTYQYLRDILIRRMAFSIPVQKIIPLSFKNLHTIHSVKICK